MEAAVAIVLVAAILAYAGGVWNGSPPARDPLPTLEVPVLATTAPPTQGMVSFDALVQHYVTAGVDTGRAFDHLPFDKPLAPDAPKPTAVSLGEAVARLPTFSVQDPVTGS